MISNCVHVVKYVRKDGSMEWQKHAWFPSTDNMGLMASSEEDMKVIMEKVNECVIEYGLKVNESKVVCTNGKVGRCR